MASFKISTLGTLK